MILGSYLGYRWFSSRPPEVWKYIPGTASVIISSDQLQQALDPAADTIPATYRDLPLVSLATGTLSMIRWFNQNNEQVSTFLKDKTITYAFHPLAGSRLGIVIYLPVKNELEKKWLDNPKPESIRVNTHNFQGQQVTDISNERSESLFSYILKDDFLIISQYGELIEDVIRNAKNGKSTANESSGFQPVREGVHPLSIYANGSSWREVVFPAGMSSNLSALLDILPMQQGFHLEPGYTADRLSFVSNRGAATENPVEKLIAGQAGTPFQNTRYISQQTTHLVRLGVANTDKFRSAFRKLLGSRRSLAPVSAFEKAAGKTKDAFYHQLGGEIILCVNESAGGLSDNKLMLIACDDFEKTKLALQQVVQKTGGTTASFQGYEIFPVQVPDLMEGLFGPVFKGFRESYVTYLEPYLIVGNNAQVVRNYLIDYENQLTWSHAPGLDSLSAYQKDDAQLLLVSNMNKVRAQSDRGRTSLKTSLDRINTTVLSYAQDGKNADLAFEIYYQAEARSLGQAELKADIEWKEAPLPEFSAMLNPVDGSSEILLTDQSHRLIEIGDGATSPKILAQLDGPMIGRAYKTDFLNIGRQQRIVATSSFLYVIDEDDNELITVLTDRAPVPLSSIDRMNDSRESSARFLLKGSDQNLYIWERVHKAPFKLNARTTLENTLLPVVSFATGNSNYQIVTQRNGKILVLDEKGAMLKGFPVDMLSGISGAFAATQNSTTGQTEIQGVNRQGELMKVGTGGQVLDRRQLLLPAAGCSFQTIFDENSLDWLLTRQTASRAAILTKEGTEIFEIVNLKKNFAVRYHYFGSDNRFISVVSGGFVSIFDFNGNRIGDTPIPCTGTPGVAYQSAKKELNIFSQTEGKIQIWSVKL